ncbi:MAG: CRISPR-associated protein [Anaerovibrio sp.]
MGIFINHTNHPSASWSEEQLQAARQYGRVIDVDFPAVEAGWDEAAVDSLARETAGRILAMQPSAVLVQGEFTYSYALIGYLLKAGADVLAACSERCTECFVNERQETIRRSVYKFVRFRSYKTV